MIQLVINILNSRITVIRADGKIPDFVLSVEEQAMNPQLGCICTTSNIDEALKAVSDAIVEGRGD